MAYAKERKEAVLRKMMPPHNVALNVLAQEEGISEGTLYLWRQEARRKGVLLPNAESTSQGWTSKDKFAAVLETAALNEAELGEYCRKRGLYAEELAAWRQACEQANDWREAQEKQLKQQVKEQQKETQRLQKELTRKEKALAEAAALLVLKKKVDTLWGESEED
jgi:transposase-like protein